MPQPSDATESADAAATLRRRFLDAAMRVLARDGYAGFKQSTVCAETGLTTGGFYHSFPSWKDFEIALIEHWQTNATANVVATLRTIGSPEQRVRALSDVAKGLPHHTERALRVWAEKDPDVARAVAEVDQTRYDAIAEFAGELLADPDAPERLAAHSMLVLIGYQCSSIDAAAFGATLEHIRDEALALPRKPAQTSE
ncbi:TetR/AcrR family transcriptional regulator [Gordonia hydrophobica]|uniref:TetR/AcrR family transcriptional regulator n=1 Tax=Gordonia hydrophobica TaxID=40516 RepID=A0ABZ2U6R6_9ACTN|nr:TetR/AcrR family transcriptional regulator [Gordonia hydrophobica]MBM7365478.1 AcrR family transcriptional regulator [Gordonia hydrophobica]